MPVFNPELARLAGVQSGVSRRLHPVKRSKKPVQALPDLSAQDAVQDAIERQLVLTKEQIARTREVLNDTSYRYCEHCERGGIEPHHRAQLLKALDTLLERERILRMIPAPGNTRPAVARAPKASYASATPPAGWDTPTPQATAPQAQASAQSQHTGSPSPEASPSIPPKESS